MRGPALRAKQTVDSVSSIGAKRELEIAKGLSAGEIESCKRPRGFADRDKDGSQPLSLWFELHLSNADRMERHCIRGDAPERDSAVRSVTGVHFDRSPKRVRPAGVLR